MMIRWIFPVLILTLFFSCSTPYNSIDTSTLVPLKVPSPTELTASKGSPDYKNGIVISVLRSPLADRTDFYRSDSLSGPYNKIQLEHGFIDINTVPGKIYYYKAKSFSSILGESSFSNTDSGYRSGSEEDLYEPDSGTGQARILTPNVSQELHSIYPLDDQDWFRFEAVSATSYTIDIYSSGNTQNDLYVLPYLYDSSFNKINQITVTGNFFQSISNWYCTTGGTYYIRITADPNRFYNTTGDYKIKITATQSPPAVPQNLTVSDNTFHEYIKISWNKSEHTDCYEVYRSNSYSGPFLKIPVLPWHYSADPTDDVTGTFAYDQSAESGTLYYYQVRAKNIHGNSPFTPAVPGKKRTESSDLFEDDDIEQEANILPIEDIYSNHTLNPAADRDYFQFQTEAGKNYTLTLVSYGENKAILQFENTGSLHLTGSSLVYQNNIHTETRSWNASASQIHTFYLDHPSEFIYYQIKLTY